LTGYSWGSTPELVSDVQAWRLDSASNFGWLLTTDVVDSGRRFYSRESRRPALESAACASAGRL
jgi:hypothetical protein